MYTCSGNPLIAEPVSQRCSQVSYMAAELTVLRLVNECQCDFAYSPKWQSTTPMKAGSLTIRPHGTGCRRNCTGLATVACGLVATSPLPWIPCGREGERAGLVHRESPTNEAKRSSCRIIGTKRTHTIRQPYGCHTTK